MKVIIVKEDERNSDTSVYDLPDAEAAAAIAEGVAVLHPDEEEKDKPKSKKK